MTLDVSTTQTSPVETHHPFEKIPVRVFNQAQEASAAIARQIADLVQQRAAEGKTAVLGLATGSTPVGEEWSSYRV